MTRPTLLATLVLMLAPAVSTPAYAEWNPTPIAVPLVNAETVAPGPGAPYPSTIDVAPEGGAIHQAFITVTLHAVTHPCPDDLAVLLVRGAEKYLLMSNAGGCRPLQGTDIRITTDLSTFELPDNAAGPPHGATLDIRPSNYAPEPVFPAPAPAGPYTIGLPSVVNVQGTWSLYVMDLHAANRGVVAGGWSITYSPLFFTATADAPALIPATGPVGPYPITFDLSQVDAATRVAQVFIDVELSHGHADDLRMVLESPNGTAVVLMANAGGDTALTPATLVRFVDGAGALMPDGPLGPGTFLEYKPGSVYELPIASLPSPAPTAPYATTFFAFDGELARGIWKLWVYDDAEPDAGQFVASWLYIAPAYTLPGLSIFRPVDPMSTADQPFTRIEGVGNNTNRPFVVTWRNIVNGEFYDAGALPTGAYASLARAFEGTVPLKKGTNVIDVSLLSNAGSRYGQRVTITVNEFAYTLSEGSTGGFFDEDVTIANPTSLAAPITVDFLQEGAAPITHADTVAADAPRQLHVDDLGPTGAVSTVVHSTNAVPLAVERTMSWDATGYGGHGGTAIVPNTQWLFAEGSQGFFDTFILIANDNATPVDATVRFFLEGGGAVNHPVTLQPRSRVTVFAGDIPALVNQSFGIEVVSSGLPITAERAMYFPHSGARLFEGGHEAAGANRVSTHWFLAEGATGPFFECFVLLSNPGGFVAHTTLTYLLPSGETVAQTIDVPPNGRSTINVETVDPRLVNTPVSTIVTADRGIVVERSMYWPDISLGWREAHNSIGIVDPALRWGVSDIRVGGTRGYQTYVLLANPNATPAEVNVRLLRSGAAPIEQTMTLQPTSRTNIFAGDLAGDGTYSMDVQVLNYQPIVVEKALYWDAGGQIWAAGTDVVATPLPPQ